MKEYAQTAVEYLKQLIAIPSVSREEDKSADLLGDILQKSGHKVSRKGNNIWVSHMIDSSLPTILLNSHHDTVKPTSSWSRDPFSPVVEENRLYGLGSNDAGASLVSLLMVFLHFEKVSNPTFNLIYAATAEEEVTGKGGISLIMDELPPLDLAIVGEPTRMRMAIAEKGLMVLDGITRGQSGHAAREEGVNALYLALEDIAWFRSFKFPHESELLGPVKMSVTVIQSGYQHNIVPDTCSYVVDVRTNEFYKNSEALAIIQSGMKHSQITPRSTHINSSRIELSHPVVQKALSMGVEIFGSPTTSDQARIPYTSLKMGPGDSARSHTADEYICLNEIEEGITGYIELLNDLDIRSER